MRFGRLIVTGKAKNIGIHTAWTCRCDCGNECIVTTNSLRSGNTKSCGCYHKDKAREQSTRHGETKTRLWYIWYGMRARCKYPSHNRYKYYGGKGINVCEDWEEYENFKNWAVKNGYKDGLTIDRIDSGKDYCPENCRWVTKEENNRRAAQKHLITISGETFNTTQWDKKIGAFSGCVAQWIRRYGEPYAEMRIKEKMGADT